MKTKAFFGAMSASSIVAMLWLSGFCGAYLLKNSSFLVMAIYLIMHLLVITIELGVFLSCPQRRSFFRILFIPVFVFMGYYSFSYFTSSIPIATILLLLLGVVAVYFISRMVNLKHLRSV